VFTGVGGSSPVFTGVRGSSYVLTGGWRVICIYWWWGSLSIICGGDPGARVTELIMEYLRLCTHSMFVLLSKQRLGAGCLFF